MAYSIAAPSVRSPLHYSFAATSPASVATRRLAPLTDLRKVSETREGKRIGLGLSSWSTICREETARLYLRKRLVFNSWTFRVTLDAMHDCCGKQ